MCYVLLYNVLVTGPIYLNRKLIHYDGRLGNISSQVVINIFTHLLHLIFIGRIYIEFPLLPEKLDLRLIFRYNTRPLLISIIIIEMVFPSPYSDTNTIIYTTKESDK